MAYRAKDAQISPPVRARSISFPTLVRIAEGTQYQARLKYPVYQFGGGQIRRIFTQDV